MSERVSIGKEARFSHQARASSFIEMHGENDSLTVYTFFCVNVNAIVRATLCVTLDLVDRKVKSRKKRAVEGGLNFLIAGGSLLLSAESLSLVFSGRADARRGPLAEAMGEREGISSWLKQSHFVYSKFDQQL